jgi:hypothetical protein
VSVWYPHGTENCVIKCNTPCTNFKWIYKPASSQTICVFSLNWDRMTYTNRWTGRWSITMYGTIIMSYTPCIILYKHYLLKNNFLCTILCILNYKKFLIRHVLASIDALFRELSLGTFWDKGLQSWFCVFSKMTVNYNTQRQDCRTSWCLKKCVCERVLNYVHMADG